MTFFNDFFCLSKLFRFLLSVSINVPSDVLAGNEAKVTLLFVTANINCFALVMLMFICCKNVSFGSRAISRIFGCFVVGSVSLFNLSDQVMPYSAGSDVKSVVVVCLCLCERLLVVAHIFCEDIIE